MNLQIIGISIQAHLLTKILTVQGPTLEDKNHDFTWVMNKRYDGYRVTEYVTFDAMRVRLQINARLDVYAPLDIDTVISGNQNSNYYWQSYSKDTQTYY